MDGEIVNRVEQSGIITLDLEVLVPDRELLLLDIKDQLFQGLILREKDFRAWVKEQDWTQYAGSNVAIYCSADAIVPTWAYMLLSSVLRPHTSYIYFSKPDGIYALIAERELSSVDPNDYKDKRVVIKGCGEREISNHAYALLTSKLVPFVKSLMYGEPCSTVPVYKQPRK